MKNLLAILFFLPCLLLAQHDQMIEEIDDDRDYNVIQTGNNTISLQAYNNIKINGVSLKIIQNFEGSSAALSTLLRTTFTQEKPDPEAINFTSTNLVLAYGNVTSDWILYYLEFLNSNVTLNILGKTVKLGDDISLLGFGTNLKSRLIAESGERSAIFCSDLDSSYTAVRFDPITKKITKIYYLSPT